jgi:hypothetical protein
VFSHQVRAHPFTELSICIPLALPHQSIFIKVSNFSKNIKYERLRLPR